MFEIIVLGIVFFIGYQVGMSVFAYRIRHILYKEAKRQGINVTASSLDLVEDSPVINRLFIEKANDVLYLYDLDENTFICQASTIDELASLAKKYKNIKYAVVENNGDMLMFVEGAVKTK